MPRLPDRFDLWIRQARACPDPERAADYVLGSLASLDDWHFLNLGDAAKPRPAEVELEGARYLLVFSDPGRIEELLATDRTNGVALPVFSIPTAAAMPWCLERGADGIAGLMVNPGEDGFSFPLAHLAEYHREWLQRGARQASGYWIPSMTSEEEDFWQEHGL